MKRENAKLIKNSIFFCFFQDAVSLVGGAIGAMHIPEKWFPGYMDYYLNSHNIMHVLVVVAVYSMHQVSHSFHVSDILLNNKDESHKTVKKIIEKSNNHPQLLDSDSFTRYIFILHSLRNHFHDFYKPFQTLLYYMNYEAN